MRHASRNVALVLLRDLASCLRDADLHQAFVGRNCKMFRESPRSQEQCIGCVTMNLPAGSSLSGPRHVTLVPAKFKTQLQSTDG